MSTQLFLNIQRYIPNKSTDLVMACAWCPKTTYPKLKINQQYTHGMCEKHKQGFIIRISERVGKSIKDDHISKKKVFI